MIFIRNEISSQSSGVLNGNMDNNRSKLKLECDDKDRERFRTPFGRSKRKFEKVIYDDERFDSMNSILIAVARLLQNNSRD